MSFSKKKIVCVDWEDASSNSGYWSKKDTNEFSTVNARTIGYMVEKNKKMVKLCTENFEDGGFRHVHCIPKGMVRKITVLSKGD